jgi:alkyl sulfatase BDS1-like metallo-beta-lactamase superfamily hydrolase
MTRVTNPVILLGFSTLATFGAPPQMTADNPRALVLEGSSQTKAEKVNDSIYRATGFGNTYMVTTPEGNVIIDTSLPLHAPRHVKLLKAVSAAPIRYIILTHAHGDHTGGVALWTEAGTKIVAQRQHVEFMHYQKRLEGFLTARAAAQFALAIPKPGPWAGNYAAKIVPNVLFDDQYEFRLGGLTFQIFHTPGETPDHLTVWIPELRAAFSGDNYYQSFPNLYTLRGTEPRHALDYVSSLNRVIALKPEFLLPSHGAPVQGDAEIERRLIQYRDAILYVHDAVVKGLNEGKDVYTLMREVRLPKALDVGESYGKLTWSVRGIYEGYVGWFDLNPATMYDLPPTVVDADLVRLAGSEGVLKLASQRIQEQRLVEALRLTDAALSAEPHNTAALRVRVETLRALIVQCRNTNERGWLDFALAQGERQLSVAQK